MFNVYPLASFTDNYIWTLEDHHSNRVSVVDPGDHDIVITMLEKQGKVLDSILLTHHHWDHTDGVNALVERYDVPVYGPDSAKIKSVTHPLITGQHIELFQQTLKVQEIPGHTLDHICYFAASANNKAPSYLFCGDTLFLAGCGRVFEGTMQQMLDAMNYFKSLPLNTAIYCTHEYSLNNLAFAAAVEPNNAEIQHTINQCRERRSKNQPTLPTSLNQELNINPFLRFDQLPVQQMASLVAGRPQTSDLDVFTTLREWKNNF